MNPKIKVSIGKGRSPVELQQLIDTDLKTKSKNVTGAINELFEKQELDKQEINQYVSDEIESKLHSTSLYRYKGSVISVNDLPSSPEIGDVWNIETAGGDGLRLIPFTSVEVDIAGAYVGYYDVTKYPVVEDGEEWMNVDLYDENCNLILASQNLRITTEYVFSPPIDSVFLTAKYFQLTDRSDIGTVIGTSVNAGDNVAWTGSEWDVLSGTIDTSTFATKDYIESYVNEAILGGAW